MEAGLLDAAVQIVRLHIILVLIRKHIIEDLDRVRGILLANDRLLDIQARNLARDTVLLDKVLLVRSGAIVLFLNFGAIDVVEETLEFPVDLKI